MNGAMNWQHSRKLPNIRILPFQVAPDVIDPRQMIKALDQKLPKDWFMVNSSGHCSYGSYDWPFGCAFLTIREFGAIGNGLSYAIGVAAARPETQVVLIDGDGGFDACTRA